MTTKTEKAKLKKNLALLQEEFNFSYEMCKKFIGEDEKNYNYHDGRKDGIRLTVSQLRKLLGDKYP